MIRLASMTEKPSEPEDEKEAERRFNETLRRMLKTPHHPHSTKTPPGKPKGVRGSATARKG